MKKHLLLFGILMLSGQIFSQEITWVNSLGGINEDEASSIVTDISGNSYCLGRFAGSNIDFDPSSGTTILNSNGGSDDVYLTKSNANGQLIWAISFGGANQDIPKKIKLHNNEIVIAGHFFGSMDAEPGSGTTTLTSNGDFDAFIVKLDTSGSLVWAKNFGSGTGGDDFIFSMDVDPSGNIYSTGSFNGTGDFNPGIGVATLTTNGFNDIFISKLDPNGNLLWVKQIGGADDDYGYAIAVDLFNVYLTGSFRSMVDFDPNAGIANLISSAGNDAFVMRLDLNGVLGWANKFGGAGTNSEYGTGVTIASNGDPIFTGIYASLNIDFNPEFSNFIMSPAGGFANYIVRLTQNNGFVWAKQFTSSGAGCQANDINTTSNNDIILGGYFNNSIDFDPSGSVFSVTSQGQNDAFLTRLTSNGDFISVKTFGGIFQDNLIGLNKSSNDELFAAGYFSNTGNFLTNSGFTSINSNGFTDAFSFKIGVCQPDSVTDNQTACGSFTWINGNTYTNSILNVHHTLTNVGGCDSVIILNLIINPIPSNTTSVSGITITAQQAGANYQWIDCNNGNQPIAGENNQSFTPSTNGSYAVIVSNNSNCSDTSSCTTINGVGISESLKNRIEFYPNPTSELVHFNQLASGKIINLKGQVEFEFSDTNAVSISHLPKGIYLVEIIDDETSYITKIIIQ